MRFDSPSFVLGAIFATAIAVLVNIMVEAESTRILDFKCSQLCGGKKYWGPSALYKIDDLRGCICLQEVKK